MAAGPRVANRRVLGGATDATLTAVPNPAATIAPSTCRLGQLQRGRGRGFRLALADGDAAHDDLLQCLIIDPRVDSQIESRERYYAELLAALDLSLDPLVAHLAGRDAELGHAVLAGAWQLGHPATRSLLAATRTDERIVDGIAEQLWGLRWGRLVDLPPRAAKVFLREALLDAECARSERRYSTSSSLPGEMSVADLLELGRQMPAGQRWAIVEELCRRGTEVDRVALAETVQHDIVFDRVRLAASALGTLGDERLVSLATDYFAREDVFEDAARRLSGYDRMRRSALNDYVRHLPIDRQLELAREWHPLGGYFEVVAGGVFGAQATPDDRARLESFVEGTAAATGGWEFIQELDALARIGDPRSAPLLIQIAAEASYSHARRRALHGLAIMPDAPGAAQALHEALWDCEDEAAADGCAFLPTLDADALGRVTHLASHDLAHHELRVRASRRLANEGSSPNERNRDPDRAKPRNGGPADA